MRATIGILVASACFTACATAPDIVDNGDVYDPLEPMNRNVTAFNNGVDKYALGPVARGYETVTPEVVRTGVSNVSKNLGEPATFVNSVLQGEPNLAADSFFRFLVNSTVGVAGVWDPAEKMGLEPHSEDFGQTLAVWGVPEGAYLVLPGLGPSNIRDAFGKGVDAAFRPGTWIQFGNDTATDVWIESGIGTAATLNTRAQFEEQIQQLNEQPEPYVALKRLYSSQRQAAIRNGVVNEETEFDDLPDFDEFGE